MAAAGTDLRWLHRTGSFLLDEPVVMGVLNVTPDSFSDGGRFNDTGAALARAEQMVAEGAAIIDVGGESTRPGAAPVDIREEISRVLPVIRELRARLDTVISIDTRRPEVARAALEEGADIVNDVSALEDPGMAAVVSEFAAGLVLMHMRGTPATMQKDPYYEDVAGEVASELSEKLARAASAGIEAERIVLDPGIGFAKSFAHNIELIARLDVLTELGRPVLLGVSRKAFLGALIGGAPPEERVSATAAASVLGLIRGARIFRVHDVRPVREALQVANAIRLASQPAL